MSGLTSGSGETIKVRGYDLSQDLIGKRSFVEVYLLLVLGRMPDEATVKMTDGILVTLLDHGLTPSAMSARLTQMGAPGNLSAAVASGLLGAGSRYLGTTAEVARMLYAWSKHEVPRPETTDQLVASLGGEAVPGFGHPIHKSSDPRVDALLGLQSRLGLPTDYSTFLRSLEVSLGRATKKHLPINAAGAAGAIICDLGLPAEFGLAFALVARSAGLTAHVLDEASTPLGPELWRLARELGG